MNKRKKTKCYSFSQYSDIGEDGYKYGIRFKVYETGGFDKCILLCANCHRILHKWVDK